MKENGLALPYVNDQTEEICKIAVYQYGRSLGYVRNQTEEICKITLEEDERAIRYVHDDYIDAVKAHFAIK